MAKEQMGEPVEGSRIDEGGRWVGGDLQLVGDGGETAHEEREGRDQQRRGARASVGGSLRGRGAACRPVHHPRRSGDEASSIIEAGVRAAQEILCSLDPAAVFGG